MEINLNGRHIDSGWYKVSAKEAKTLCKEAREAGMGLNAAYPKPGRERRVKVNDELGWLARTQHHEKVVWAVHGLSPNIAAYRKPKSEEDSTTASDSQQFGNGIESPNQFD